LGWIRGLEREEKKDVFNQAQSSVKDKMNINTTLADKNETNKYFLS
jgi:hypothetical protein